MGKRPAGDPLLDKLRSPRRYTRQRAILTLGRERRRDAFEVIRDRMDDRDWLVRQAVARVLGDWRDPRGIPTLLKALRDPHSHVRWQAAESLCRVQDRTCIGPLVAALADDGPFEIADNAARALRKAGPAALPALVAFARKPSNGRGRWWAIETACRIDRAAGARLARTVANDRDSDVRRAAVEALRFGGGRPADVRLLVKALSDTSDFVKEAAAKALGSLGAKASLAELERVAKEGDLASEAALQATSRIDKKRDPNWYLEALASDDWGILAAAADGIRGRVTPELLTVLLRLMERPDPAPVASAFRKCADSNVANFLVERLSSRDVLRRRVAVSALSEMNARVATPGLVRALGDRERLHRIWAFKALAQAGTSDAVEAAMRALPGFKGGEVVSVGKGLAKTAPHVCDALVADALVDLAHREAPTPDVLNFYRPFLSAQQLPQARAVAQELLGNVTAWRERRPVFMKGLRRRQRS